MYTIVLVDDERGIAEGIRFLLEESEADIQVVGIAGDGYEGGRLILEKKPDIVIADVRMPVMDGLQMIERLKEKGCEARFIMLSGYSEFEYAKQAIRLGVKYYICKPVEEEELFDAIGKICKEIEEEREKKKQLVSLENEVEGYKRDRRELQLRNLLEGNMEAEEVEAVLRDNGFPDERLQYICILLEYNRQTALDSQEFSCFEKEIREQLDFYSGLQIIRYSGIQTVLLIADRKLPDEEQISVQLTKAFQQISMDPDCPVSIGIGKIYDDLAKIYLSMQEAVKALYNKVIRGIGSVICYKEIENQEGNQIPIHEDDNLRLEGYLECGDMQGCRQVIHQIFRKMQGQEGLTVRTLQLQSLNIILSGIRTMPFMQFELDEYLGKNILSLESVSRFQNVEQMENFVVNTISGIIDLKREGKKRQNKDVITQIKEYIQEHFANEISLNEIAGKFYLNPYYLSQLFKKKTGMTYQTYITSLRMEKARQLLAENYRVYEVCERVGYSDTTYFSRIFERTVGCKPSEYQKKIKDRGNFRNI